MLRRVLVVATGLACLTGLLPVLSGGPSEAAPRPLASGQTSDRVAIQQLVDQRADALMARDRAAFMATIARGSREFRVRQGNMFDWMSNVPLSSYELQVDWEDAGDLVRPSDVARYPGAEVVSIPITEERFKIEGFDLFDAVENVFFTFVKRNGGWLIASDTDLEDLTLYSARHLWSFGPVYVRSSGHFLVMGHPCRSGRNCPSVPDELLLLAEEALERVKSYWDLPWNEQVVIIVPNGPQELKRILQITFGPENFVAFATSSVDTEGGHIYTGHRIMLNPDAFETRSVDSTRDVLAHELLHIAARHSAGPFIPTFLDEGLAEYVSHQADRGRLAFFDSDVAAGLFNGHIPNDFEFLMGDSIEIFRQYQKSEAAVTYFVERWGFDKLVAFYRRLGRRALEPGTIRWHIDDALRKSVGISFEDFERAWAVSIGG